MPFDHDTRQTMLRKRAADYLAVALTNIVREYPVMPIFIASGPGSYPPHREMHPAFFGCFDWHSCVELQWVAVRLLKRFPDLDSGPARQTLSDLLAPANIAAEIRFFADPSHRSIERPYGWGWLLTLQHELATWHDPDALRWAGAVEPLADILVENLIGWLPKVTYPVRSGVHANTAFSLSRSFDYAALLSDRGDSRLRDAIDRLARQWFGTDTDYPVRYEPSGTDFLSAGLCEAELMSLVLAPEDFAAWLTTFLPGLSAGEPATLFNPAKVSDPTDGHIAHLHGLNLSRAWAFTRIAERLPEGDPRFPRLLAAAERHAAASLPQVTGSDYMVEHWLAAYATLLLG